VAQIILRWLTQRGVVAIPKSVRKERMAENFNIFDFALDPKTWLRLQRWTRKRAASLTIAIRTWLNG